MPLSFVDLPVGIVDGDEIWYPIKCRLCVCFEDDDLVDDAGTFAEITIHLTSQPSNGQNFTFNGRLFTYKTTATLPWDIQIGAILNDTLLATATALLTLPGINRADYLVFPFVGFIIVTAVKVGDDWSLSFAPGTAPMSLVGNTLGVNPTLVSTDYRVNLSLLIRNTDSLTDWVAFHGLTIVPRITADVVDSTWSAELCIPVDALLLPFITRTLPDLDDVTPLRADYDWLIDFRIRFATYSDGVETPWAESDIYTATDAICPDYLDYEEYSQFKRSDYIKYLLTRRSNLSYCIGSKPVFYIAAEAGIELTMETTYYVSGSPASNLDTLTPDRNGIVEVWPHNHLPPGYAGDVMVVVQKNAGLAGNIFYETIYYNLSGTCCGVTFYFINRFGKYEMLQCLPDAQTGLEVNVSSYTTCDTCDDRSEALEYGSKFSVAGKAYTPRLDLDSDEDMGFARDFFSSTDVRLLNEFGKLERVIVEKGTVGLRENAVQRKVRIAVNYRRQERDGN